MTTDFYARALRRIRILTVFTGLTGTAAFLSTQGARAAAGFLLGAGLSALNFKGLSNLANLLGGSSHAGPFAAVLIAGRYALIGCAAYVIVRILNVTPLAVLWGLLAAFAAVVLEILYELIFHKHE